MSRLRRTADILIVSGIAVAILIALTGGGAVSLGGFRVSVRSVARPLLVAAIGVAIRTALHRRRPRNAVADAVRLGFAILLAVVLGIAATWQVRACGGLDSYGYVSAASLVASGTLKQEEPLASVLPFDSAIRALAPLGYVATPDNSAIVPRFPLGFPLLMAPFRLLARDAVFIVPLLCGIVTVWVAYRLARERGSWIAAALAASIVAVDPVFVNQAIQPMSDVPAAMWVLAAVWLALGDRPRPVLAGFAAGFAVLTRPVLVVAAAALGAAMLRRPRTFAAWAAMAGALVAAQAVLQDRLYGSPLSSGYGTNEHLFQVSRIPANVANYARWMAVVYWPVVTLSLAALVAGGRRAARDAWPWTAAAIFLAVLAPYLLYVLFDDWEVTRFLLPGTTLLLIGAAGAAARALEQRLPARWAAVAALAIAVAVGARSYVFLTTHGRQHLVEAEAKYPIVGEWIRQHVPADAIVVASLHSGSIRYYSGRKTVRWDEIPPGRLRATIASITAAGRVSVLALDGAEEEDRFRARFGAELAGLVLMPAGRVHGRSIVTLEVRR